MSKMYLDATHSGQTVSDMLDTQARATVHLSNTFGVNAKAIGKNLNDMANDYSTFGGIAVEKQAAAAAYAAKLGIAMKDLQGITGKTDDFEGAAQAASELASSFGMTVDTMDLMSADPAEKAEMIRQSFLETGQSFDDMSRQEKARMADITGMSQEALAGAFDPANADISLDDMEAAADAAADGAISQEDANLALAKSIDKVHEALGGGSDQLQGPFSAFLDGVVKGITNSEEFLALAKNFYDVMVLCQQAGQEVGKMFVKLFPGVKLLFEGLTEFFDPAKWKKVMADVVGAFKEFFVELSTNPEEAVKNLFDKVLGIFDNFFKGESGAIGKMKEGATKMIQAIGGIIAGAIPWVTTKLVELIRGMADFLSGTGEPSDPNSIGGALKTAFGQAFSALMDALPTLIKELFLALVKVMWNNKGTVAVVGIAIGTYLAAQLVWTMAKFAMLEYVKAKIISRISGKAEADLKDKGTPPSAQATIQSLSETLDGVNEIEESKVWKAIKIAAAVVVFIAVSMVAMASAIYVAAKILSTVSWEDMAKAIISLGVAVLAVWVLSKISGKLDPASMLQGGLGLAAGALFIGISGVLFAGALWAIDKIMTGIDFMRVVEILASIGLAALAVWPAALGGAFLIADGGITLLTGGLGMLAGALFLAIAGGAFAGALLLVTSILGPIDFGTVVTTLASLGLALVATAGLAVGGALLALAIPALIAAGPGLKAGGKLLTIAGDEFAAALTAVIKSFSKVPGGIVKVEQAMGLILAAMTAVAGLSVLGAAFAVFMPVVMILSKGISAAADFAETAFKDVGRVIDSIAAIDIVDPERVKQVVEIVGAVVGAMADIGSLGVQMAMVGAAAEIFGDMSMDDMVNMSVRFIEAVGDKLAQLIILLVGLAGGMDEGALKGAGAIASMLGAMATMTDALSGPITAITESKGAMDSLVNAVFGDSIQEKIAASVEGMVAIMDAIGPTIPKLVASMAKGLGQMPEGMGEKAQAFGDMLEGVGKILSVWGDYKKDAGSVEGADEIEFDPAAMKTGIETLTSIIGWDGWAATAAAMTTASELTIDPVVGEAFIGSMNGLATMSQGVNEAMTAIAESGIDYWAGDAVSEVVGKVAEIVEGYNAQAEKLASLSPINIDAVLAQVNDSLQVRRDKITIADGNVTINMSLNVTMKAEDVAKPMIDADLVLKGSSSKVSSLGSSTA